MSRSAIVLSVSVSVFDRDCKKKKKKKKNSYSGSSLLHVAVLNYHDCERMFIRRVSASEPRFC